MVIAGIVAGGIGSRMGQNIMPKQFLSIAGKPIIVHTIEKFLASPVIDGVVVGVHPEWINMMNDLLGKYFEGKYFEGVTGVTVVPGGKNRNETILNIVEGAKEIFKADKDSIIVSHDAVRPFLSLKIIEDNVKAAEEFGVCDTVVGATDTIVQSEEEGFITNIPVRKTMYQGQTPQSFKIELFEKVYNSMTKEELELVTDACKMFYMRGYKVKLVEGNVSNFKITYPFDLKMAHTMLGEINND